MFPDRNAPGGRCHGTNKRGAVRCRRASRPGEFTCGLHKDQDVTALVELRKP